MLKGVIYDVIVEPPSVGSTTDAMGRSKPVNILKIISMKLKKIITKIFLGCIYAMEN